MKKKSILRNDRRRTVSGIAVLVMMCVAMAWVGCQKENGEESSSGLTLKQIRTAAEKAGYETENGHTFGLYSEVIDGFTLHTLDCGSTDLYAPVLECKDEKAAIAVEKREAAAGYNLPVRNGKFITFYNKPDLCGEEEKAVLIGVLKANPPAPKYSN
jgi:hypothetical protein